MKKLGKIGLFIFGFIISVFAGCFTSAKDYEYTNLYIVANILSDGTINVREDFTANFFVNKHGIIRDIPLNYSVEGKDFHIDVSNINVVGKHFTTSKNNGNIEIKIGDADKTVIGEQKYPISYSTYGLIRNFSGMGYAELYWNLVGYDFDTNINKVRAEIYLPITFTGFTDDDFLITVDGSTKTLGEFGGKVDWKGGNKIVVTYDKGLQAYQGITLAVKFPNNYFQFDHDKQAKLVGLVSGNGILSLDFFSGNFLKIFAIIFGVFAVFICAFKFLSRGKGESYIHKSEIEDKLNKESPIVVRYAPPAGINCAEAGMLYNCILEPTDLTSLLYKWVIEGLISLRVEESVNFEKIDGFVMTKLKNIDGTYPSYEVDFFRYLLPGELNSKRSISKSSALDVANSLKSLRNYGRSRGWITVGFFSDNKGFIGILSAIVLFFVCLFLKFDLEVSIFFSVLLASFFNGKSDFPSQKKISLTDEGKRIALDVIGYAKFIQACDENKLRLFLKQDPAFFDKTLPYAVAFGFETSFIQKITPVLRELDVRPTRYSGDLYEMNSINSIVNTAIREQELRKQRERQASYDRSDGFSGGSGFSFGGFSRGGGGGGGGGRSW